MNGNNKGRTTERLFLILNTLVLSLLFFQLYRVLGREFEDTDSRLSKGTIVNLNAPQVRAGTAALLKKGYYFSDVKDINLIADIIGQAAKGGSHIDNIGELNKKRCFVPAHTAWILGGESFRKRVLASQSLLGLSEQKQLAGKKEAGWAAVSSVTDIGLGAGIIQGVIKTKEDGLAGGVPVRLEMVLPQDSLYDITEAETARQITETGAGFSRTYISGLPEGRKLQALEAAATTDAQGRFTFKNLPEHCAYEVLPLQQGFQFGSTKGIEDLSGKTSFTFYKEPHTIRLFSARDFNILKKEGAWIVRTPAEFRLWYCIIAAGFFLGFFLLHAGLKARFPTADQMILPLIMLLTGFSFLTFLSLQDPLRDRFLAKDSLLWYGTGVTGIFLLMFLDLKRFTADSFFYRLLVFKRLRSAANGWPWAAIATGLLLATILFGYGPEGSGVKVNLLGVQPSELIKFCLILFLAGFLSLNEKFISEYTSYKKRWSFFSFALAAVLFSILLFFMLGDLGPAMVICFTFIILFSFSRSDFGIMIAVVVLYVLAVWAIENVWLATAVTVAATALIFFFYRKQLSESAVMALVVIAGFLLLDQVPMLDKAFPGPVQRLSDRKAIWQDAWNNEVFGGDHVANSIWAMASGGLTGQGIGEGFAKTIPEAHTDMVLPAFAEEFGWTGIVCVFILFLVYLHRAIVIGRQTGRPFLFYLCAGIGISTFVQFLLIAGGSTGALPLSGVALPFISYGGSSLVANMLAAGFLLSASTLRGSQVQMAYISKQQDRNLMPALLAATVAVILLTVNVSKYLFDNKKWVVLPALVADRGGSRMFSYNPRIAILMNKLQAGSLLDRSGRILATSEPGLIRAQRRELGASGAGSYNIDSAMHKRESRYYPFAEQMFFWTGDANTGVFNGSINGYFGEYEHAAELRGFKTPESSFEVKASRYREDRFLPRGIKEMTVSKRDYSALSPLLLAGINSQSTADFRKRNRNVQLTVDAALQARIQQSVAADTSLMDNRVSVVIMNSASGDVLTSAVYPLPPVKDWDRLTMSVREQNTLNDWVTTSDLGFTYATPPGSTAKVLTTLAAFNKMGPRAAQRTFPVYPKERIRTRGIEPDETGVIGLERALVKSNNVYFIKLANEEKLQDEMADLYLKTGMFLHGVGGFYYNRGTSSSAEEDKWRELWKKTEFNIKPVYDPANIRRTRARGISGMAWGQGELIATPAAVARLAGGIANKGTMVNNRFVLKISDSVPAGRGTVQLAKDTAYAGMIRSYMIMQSKNKVYQLKLSVAGKSGTPERVWKNEKINDGWYVFFAPSNKGKGDVVVCIRIESTRGSSDAVRLAGKHVIPVLLKMGYVKGPEQ